MCKISIQYTMLGFDPTIFRTRVSSHNHKTSAPTPDRVCYVLEPLLSLPPMLLLLLYGVMATHVLTHTAEQIRAHSITIIVNLTTSIYKLCKYLGLSLSFKLIVISWLQSVWAEKIAKCL